MTIHTIDCTPNKPTAAELRRQLVFARSAMERLALDVVGATKKAQREKIAKGLKASAAEASLFVLMFDCGKERKS